MNYKGLIITLLAGAVVAGGSYAVTTNLSHDVADTGAWREGGANATAGITQVPSASPSAAPSPSKAPDGRNTFAGTTDGGEAGLAIAMNNGKAVAYICDGRKAESWMNGVAESGQIVLRSAKGTGSLTGTYADGVATGTVTAGKKTWRFRIVIAKPPSGLYRSAANVRNRLQASWAVVPIPPSNAIKQFGVQEVNGVPQPAPPLNTDYGSTTVDGTTFPVTSVPAPQ